MLRTKNLSGFGQHARRTNFRQQIGSVAQRWVGRDAGKGIGPATVQSQLNFGRRNHNAFFRGHLFHQTFNGFNGVGHGVARSAFAL